MNGKKPTTIAQRALMFRMAAEACGPESKSKDFYKETADVLEAIAHLYNDLYETARDVIERCNGEDPALNILAAKMREHMTQRTKVDGMDGVD